MSNKCNERFFVHLETKSKSQPRDQARVLSCTVFIPFLVNWQNKENLLACYTHANKVLGGPCLTINYLSRFFSSFFM